MQWFSLLLVLLADPTDACVAMQSTANAVVTTTTASTTTASTTTASTTTASTTTASTTTASTTTEITTTTASPCNPLSITYGTSDSDTYIDVTYSNYVVDTTTGTASMTISCTAQTGYYANMEFNGNEGGPPDNYNFVQTISITVTCSSDTAVWVYTEVVNGVSYTRVINEVTCQEA